VLVVHPGSSSSSSAYHCRQQLLSDSAGDQPLACAVLPAALGLAQQRAAAIKAGCAACARSTTHARSYNAQLATACALQGDMSSCPAHVLTGRPLWL
jgi:hypothetical protein